MAHDQWSLRMLSREAVKNIFSPVARLFPVIAVAVLLGAVQSALIVHESDLLIATLADLQMRGRNVVVSAPRSAESPSTVTRQSCEGLASYPQVVNAGLVQPGDPADFLELGSLVPVQAASTTLVPDLATHDAVIGSALSPGVHIAKKLRMPSGQVLHAAVGTPQPAGVPVNSVLSVPLDVDTSTGVYCVVVFDPLIPPSTALEIVVADLQVIGDPLYTSSPFVESVDVVSTYLTRPERFLPVGIALSAGFSTFAMSGFRSSEFAAYRLSGTTRRSLMIIVMLEQAMIAGFYLSSATASSLALGTRLTDPSVPVLWAVVGALAWTLSAGSAAAASSLRRASDLAKDR